jgi:hypothetical protein
MGEGEIPQGGGCVVILSNHMVPLAMILKAEY